MSTPQSNDEDLCAMEEFRSYVRNQASQTRFVTVSIEHANRMIADFEADMRRMTIAADTIEKLNAECNKLAGMPQVSALEKTSC